MSEFSGLRERLGLPAKTPEDRPVLSGIPVLIRLRTNDAFDKPITLSDMIRKIGLTLSEAHKVLNELKNGREVRVIGRVNDMEEFMKEMTSLHLNMDFKLIPESRMKEKKIKIGYNSRVE